MPDDVVNLATRRRDKEVARCTCGSEWFALERRETGESQPGAVTLTQAGMVSGYAGEPFCTACGKRWWTFQ